MSAKLLAKKTDLGQQQVSKPQLAAVDEMTSRDFHKDVNAHVDNIGQLLKDQTHCLMYREAIIYNKHLFRGRSVLHLGCGVGLLSLFAAQAGAAKVYAVDDSNVTDYAKRVVQQNNWSHVVQVFKARIEDLQLPVAQVDIILCDFPGYSLFFQSLCGSIIYARDKWLRPGGLIFPDLARLYVAALSDPQHRRQRIDWWLDVYGFNMQVLRKYALSEPRYKQVTPDQIMSTQYTLHTLNLNKATMSDLKFRSKFLLTMQREGAIDGLVTYFQFGFSKAHTPITISTAPTAPLTRWLQTAFYFDQPLRGPVGSIYCGGFEMCALDGIMHNQMAVAVELFSGDLTVGLQLELELRWQLQPHVLFSPDAEQQETTEDAAHAVKVEQLAEKFQKTFSNEQVWCNRGFRKHSAKSNSIKSNAQNKEKDNALGNVAHPCLGERRHKNKKGKRTKKR